MIRALAGVEASADNGERPSSAVLYCHLGDVTNLAVARGTSCLFTRVSHVGLEAIAGGLAASRGLVPDHAVQWLNYVGLERPVEQIEGDPETVAAARQALEDGVTGLIDELRLSLDYYGAQESALPVERIVLCGPGSTIAGLPGRMEAGLGFQLGVSRPAALSGFDEISAARLTLPYGLALEH
jgi:type IV pilus assembly protein PilM